MKDFSNEFSNELPLQTIEIGVSNQSARGILATPYLDIPDQDDRYPGSFFRIPGLPIPGKTTWSIK